MLATCFHRTWYDICLCRHDMTWFHVGRYAGNMLSWNHVAVDINICVWHMCYVDMIYICHTHMFMSTATSFHVGRHADMTYVHVWHVYVDMIYDINTSKPWHKYKSCRHVGRQFMSNTKYIHKIHTYTWTRHVTHKSVCFADMTCVHGWDEAFACATWL